MKPDLVFILENAAWPALLLDGSGAILRANPAAVKTFGPALEGEAPLLSAIWSAENGSDAGAVPRALGTFAGGHDGAQIAGPGRRRRRVFNSRFAPSARMAEKFFVFQAVPEAAAAGDEKNQSPEASLAQKQKLDCALQLARTVSLDFNNALTGVLAHTSLLLGKAEPGHPWRHSLMEVEKSAERAAEISNELAAFSRQETEAPRAAAGNLNAVVNRCVEFFRNARGAAITWQLQLEKGLFAARFDEAKLQQALMKVLENAVEAVAGGRRPNHGANAQSGIDRAGAGPECATGGGHLCVRGNRRQRRWDRAGGVAPDFRAVLHDQGRSASRPRPGAGLWHREQSRRRRGGVGPAGRGHFGADLSAGGKAARRRKRGRGRQSARNGNGAGGGRRTPCVDDDGNDPDRIRLQSSDGQQRPEGAGRSWRATTRRWTWWSRTWSCRA